MPELDNPHFLTMEDYLNILEEVLRASGGGFFGRFSHPEDIGAAVETANSHIEAVLSYQTRKWWADNKEKPASPSGHGAVVDAFNDYAEKYKIRVDEA